MCFCFGFAGNIDCRQWKNDADFIYQYLKKAIVKENHLTWFVWPPLYTEDHQQQLNNFKIKYINYQQNKHKHGCVPSLTYLS